GTPTRPRPALSRAARAPRPRTAGRTFSSTRLVGCRTGRRRAYRDTTSGRGRYRIGAPERPRSVGEPGGGAHGGRVGCPPAGGSFIVIRVRDYGGARPLGGGATGRAGAWPSAHPGRRTLGRD